MLDVLGLEYLLQEKLLDSPQISLISLIVQLLMNKNVSSHNILFNHQVRKMKI